MEEEQDNEKKEIDIDINYESHEVVTTIDYIEKEWKYEG